MSFLLNLLQFFDPLAWSQQSRRRAWFWNFDHLYDLLRLWVPFLLLAKIQAMRRTRWRTEMKSSMVRVDQWAATLSTIDSMVEESRFILCARPVSWIPHLPTFHVTWHRAPGTWKFRCQVPAPGTSPKPGKWGIPEKSFQNAVQECLLQVTSALQSKVITKTSLRQLRLMYFAL